VLSQTVIFGFGPAGAVVAGACAAVVGGAAGAVAPDCAVAAGWGVAAGCGVAAGAHATASKPSSAKMASNLEVRVIFIRVFSFRECFLNQVESSLSIRRMLAR
jgi:hypothetical protein